MPKLIDLTGKKFGRLTVLNRADNIKNRVRWNCVCDCGIQTTVDGANLKTGNTTSCGCQRVDSASKVRPGMKFGRLTVLARDGARRYGRTSFTNWYCACECGKFKSVIGMSLMNGDTRSCGCLHRESATRNGTASAENLTGREFGDLVVIERASFDRSGNIKWLCACTCGNLTILRGHSLTSGRTISCGCKAHQGKTFRPDLVRLKARIHGARRRALEIARTKPWDEELFELVENEAYELAQRRTRMTGEPWEVDHIVPLRSDIVCGLHNEHNLAVITAKANITKRNRSWPNMP